MERIRQESFQGLVDYMKKNYGINLEQKLMLVEDRLSSVMVQKGLQSLEEYLQVIQRDRTGEEANMLVARLTTNYTYFMRESAHYQFMAETILPHLKRTLPDKDIRIWSAGCSSGEEAYTTAMLLTEFFGAEKPLWDTKILATDISMPVLRMAGEGIYPEDRLKKLPPAWKSKYFTTVERGYVQISPKLKNEVVFRPFNLMETRLPFKKRFHIIFCRNVMIYFDLPTRCALVNRFYDALEPGGHLFIGMSESLDAHDTPFEFVQPSVYVKA